MKNKKLITIAISATLLVLAIIPIMLVPIILLCLEYWIPAFLVLFIYYILNAMAINSAFKNERTDIQAKLTWIFVEVLIPGGGAYIYFVFARIPKKIKESLKKSEILENDLLPTNINNSKIELIDNGMEMFPRLFDSLINAKEYINIQYFIMNPGIIHNKLFDILKQKTKEGVKVRVLYDYLGNIKWSYSEIGELIRAGIEIIEFRRIDWLKANGADNWRSHNKTIVIDGKEVYFGGNNVGDEYFSLLGKYGDWIDAHYYGVGKIVEAYNVTFISQWFIATEVDISSEYKMYPSKVSETYPNLEMIIDSPDRKNPKTFDRIIKELSEVKRRVRIITPYVAFPISFKYAIRDAIDRGVEIELITIGRADKASAYYQASFDIDTLTELGAKVYRLNNLFIHTKMFIFDDDKVIFGTSNLDYRAFFHHFETNVLLEGEQVIDWLNYFEKYKKFGILSTTNRRDWPIWRSMTYFIFRFFKGLF